MLVVLDDVLVLQVGHILRIGSLWPRFDLLKSRSFELARRRHVFQRRDEARGLRHGRTEGLRVTDDVPVENTACSRLADRRWRESVFGSEVIAPVSARGDSRPLSAITARSLEDLGYTVNAEVAGALGIGDADCGRALGAVSPVAAADCARRRRCGDRQERGFVKPCSDSTRRTTSIWLEMPCLRRMF